MEQMLRGTEAVAPNRAAHLLDALWLASWLLNWPLSWLLSVRPAAHKRAFQGAALLGCTRFSGCFASSEPELESAEGGPTLSELLPVS